MASTYCKHAPYFGGTDSSHYTYIGRISQNGLPILDNESELLVMFSECQRLRANTASDIDNKRALRKALPVIPCKIQCFEGEMAAYNVCNTA